MDEYHKRIAYTEVRRFVCSALLATGRTTDEHAGQLAEVLLAADESGDYSDGLKCLRMHCNALLSGTVDGFAKPHILRQSETVAWADGRNAIGAVVGNWCMDVAMQKARRTGIGIVCCRGSNQYGMAAWYAERAQHNDMLGMTISSNPATDAMLPPKFGFGSMAMAIAMSGHVFQFEIPIGDKTSNRFDGCLPMIREMFCTVLPGISTTERNENFDAKPANLGQTFVAVDPSFFADDFKERMPIMLADIMQHGPVSVILYSIV